MTAVRKPYAGTQAVLRAIRILKEFSDENQVMNVTDLSEISGLNRTTTYRLLTALESEGLVVRNNTSEGYRLGSEMIVLGSRALRANPLRAIVHPELLKLTAEFEESSWLDVLDGAYSLTISEVRGSYLIGAASSVGARWPAHACSTGKVLMAFAADDPLHELLKTKLVKLTAKTITNPAALRRDLEKTREQGFGIEFEELEIGHGSVATPILNHRGEGIAAISISGPSARLTLAKLEELSSVLKDAAARISFKLGYRDADSV